MQPHSNLGINFRKHFSLRYNKKRELDKVRAEVKQTEALHKAGKITRGAALKILDGLSSMFYKIKGKV